MYFTWDSGKATSNVRKHGVVFSEAATAFDDPLSTTFPSVDHSSEERRYLTIGMSASGLLLVVAHTEEEDFIRIISARVATPQEVKFYEEGS